MNQQNDGSAAGMEEAVDVLSIVKVIQEAHNPGDSISAWLDSHKDELVIVLDALGAKATALHLNIGTHTFNTWRRRRKLQGSREEGNKKAAELKRAPGAPQVPPGDARVPPDEGVVTPMTQAKSGHVSQYELDHIHGNPWQPRMAMDPAELQELADSIFRYGLLQLPVGRDREDGSGIQLAFGHRRIEAIRQLANDGKWEGTVPILVRNLTDEQMALFAFEENRKRKDLSHVEEYWGYQKALDEIEGLTTQSLADKLGIDRSTLANNLRILRLPSVVLDRFESGELSGFAAREFLCLMNDDHAHEEDMASVVRDIAQTSGSWGAPDWRSPHVRRLIRFYVISNHDVWRPLDHSEGSDANRGPEDSAMYLGPTFDIELYKQEHAQMVHSIPNASLGAAWTCNKREWQRQQTAGTRAANKERESKGESASPKTEQAASFTKVLEKDPVMKAVRKGKQTEAVSVETVAAGVVGKTAASWLGDGQRSEEYRKLNAKMAEILPGMDDAAITALRRQSRVWKDSLGLTEISDGLAEAAVGRAVDAYQHELRRLSEKQAATTQATGLNEAQAQQMGTRAQFVNLSRFNGWSQRLDPARFGFPFGFPDIKECLERCTWGATFASSYSSDAPTLYCLNQAHFQEKVAMGRAAMKEKVKEASEAEAVKDQTDVRTIINTGDLSLLRAAAVAMTQLQGHLVLATPGGRQDNELNYKYSTSERVQALLGIKGENLQRWESEKDFKFTGKEYATVQELTDEQVRDLVAQLVVYTSRIEELERESRK